MRVWGSGVRCGVEWSEEWESGVRVWGSGGEGVGWWSEGVG